MMFLVQSLPDARAAALRMVAGITCFGSERVLSSCCVFLQSHCGQIETCKVDNVGKNCHAIECAIKRKTTSSPRNEGFHFPDHQLYSTHVVIFCATQKTKRIKTTCNTPTDLCHCLQKTL